MNTRYLPFIGRVLIGVPFMMSGLSKVANYAGTTALTISALLHRNHRASKSWRAFFFDSALMKKNDVVGDVAGKTHLVSYQDHGSAL